MRAKFTWTGDNRIVTINISRILTLQKTRPTGAAWKSATTRTFSVFRRRLTKHRQMNRRHGKTRFPLDFFRETHTWLS